MTTIMIMKPLLTLEFVLLPARCAHTGMPAALANNYWYFFPRQQ